ncbi:P-loop containing nucleoside triphosphate hydrolase protein [Zopfia rhizophila CBS 207.26]|uniref:DNA 3'-5' helicase n=1 Tax=Zopfia rhizophila CBS 207.26 TaxID=1314779 RepID=A0A6A6DL92_9PEZI|nr:P-loop containing nucleoside triphosphate hydrolase protein [Zopfia rhizophila CBS 207.26]
MVNVDEQLKALLGEQAQFRSVQKPAIQAIMRQKSPVVVIMGTGGGKSVLFMLPASCSRGVTIVIVPLTLLRQDMKERCDRAGIECIVLVTPEAAVGKTFGDFINRQRTMGRLDRIVVNECHVVLDSTEGWRSRILALRELFRAETQMVYLTATLRRSEEGEFIRLMGLPGGIASGGIELPGMFAGRGGGAWIRGTTTQPNIRYQVSRYNAEKEEEALTELHELVKQLTEGRQQVFTATNALGLGADAPTIQAVVYIGKIRKMRYYAQESGRAGRDGTASKAIIMRGHQGLHEPKRFNCK